jgi:hypothetical protein
MFAAAALQSVHVEWHDASGDGAIVAALLLAICLASPRLYRGRRAKSSSPELFTGEVHDKAPGSLCRRFCRYQSADMSLMDLWSVPALAWAEETHQVGTALKYRGDSTEALCQPDHPLRYESPCSGCEWCSQHPHALQRDVVALDLQLLLRFFTLLRKRRASAPCQEVILCFPFSTEFATRVI